ncbi:DUF3800 domain-containing protein [Ruminiclostridium cellobioparum]|uniref:DUF3800 domain-containing protein n=1 Tax=Ruminiclostridium cellobioparum TaxID=29355 RepID=UPI0028ADD8AC|nr:DUF3800 domain-containing protein [Ruminiclostridium cellobioparum]
MQKVLYLDDSGTLDYSDKTQPYLIFSGPLLDNTNRNTIENKMFTIIETTKKKIETSIYWSLANSKVKVTNASKMANFISSKIIQDTFEIHTSQLIRGDNEYMVLTKDFRIDIVTQCLSLIKDNNVKIIGVVCHKKDIEDDSKISRNDKNIFMLEKTCTTLADYFDNQLKLNDDNATIVIDAGNHAIKNYFKPYIWKKTDTVISHEMMEYESHLSPLIQLADVCSYIISLHERSSVPNLLKKETDELQKNLYEIIKHNLSLVYVSDIYYPKTTTYNSDSMTTTA